MSQPKGPLSPTNPWGPRSPEGPEGPGDDEPACTPEQISQIHDDCWKACDEACKNEGGCLAADIHWDAQGCPHCTGGTCNASTPGPDSVLPEWA